MWPWASSLTFLRLLQFGVCQRGDFGPRKSTDKVVFLAWVHTQRAQGYRLPRGTPSLDDGSPERVEEAGVRRWAERDT